MLKFIRNIKRSHYIGSRSISFFDTTLRDGLQKLPKPLNPYVSMEIIESIKNANITDIEVGSFVNPKKVPAMSKTASIISSLEFNDCNLWALVPNQKGLDAAFENQSSKPINISLMGSVDDAFSKKNTGGNSEHSNSKLLPLISQAINNGSLVRTYLSCSLDETGLNGQLIDIDKTYRVVESFLNAGTHWVVLCNTLANRSLTHEHFHKVVHKITARIPSGKIALHLHGEDMESLEPVILEAYNSGISIFDVTLEGGGCSSLDSSHHNLNIFQLIDLLERHKIPHSVDKNRLQSTRTLLLDALSNVHYSGNLS